MVTLGVAGLLSAGCTSLNPFGRDEPRAVAAAPPPAPLAPAPTGSVTASPLPPPGGVPGDPLQTAPSGLAALNPGTQTGAPGAGLATPAAAPAAGNVEVGRTDLLGGWTVAAAGDSCQLFMTLTTWSGGYRASTRGCSNAALTGISAWNMEGQQIQLLNDSGATLARLYPSSKTQFSGQTEGGGPITVSR
jgi:hypothetical protein